MLRRSSSCFVRAAECSYKANTESICLKRVVASPSKSLGARRISSSTVRAARGVLKEDERQLMAEIGKLRQEAAVYEVGVDGISKSESTLPPVTEEMLNTVYEALNVPDEPTEEEIRLEQRRLRALESSEARKDRLEKHSDHARKRLGKAVERLEQLDSFLHGFEAQEGSDHVDTILTMLQTRDGEDSRLDELQRDESFEEAAVQDVGQTFDATIPAPSLGPNEVLRRFSQSLETLHEVSAGRDDVPIVPQTLFSLQDWKAVVRLGAITADLESINESLRLMKRCGFTSMQTRVANVAMDHFAVQGDVQTIQTLLSLMLTQRVELDAYSRHCLVKCYARAERYEEAISILQSFESSTPAPLATYTLLIATLMQARTDPQLQAKIWPVFHQMRLKAHPVPDAPMYAHMLTACALGVRQPHDDMFKPSTRHHRSVVAEVNTPKQWVKKTRRADAERALDLFREMTMRYQVRPTPEVYAAVISACAGRREFYHTALRIFQSMLDQERERIDAKQFDAPSFAPDRLTFNALLRGCARNGDLKRARWILAEMLRGTVALIESIRKAGDDVRADDLALINARRPDVETVVRLLYAYANYVMPDRIGSAAVRRGDTIDEQDGVSFSEAVPTTASGLVREVDGLMERIIDDQQRTDGLLSTVKPTTKFTSAYLAVMAKWSSSTHQKPWQRANSVLFGETVEDAPLFNGESLYERWSLPIDSLTCKTVLEICEKATTTNERKDGAIDRLADRVWRSWIESQSRASDGLSLATTVVGHRQRPVEQNVFQQDVSDCWAAMIRYLAKVDKIDEAVSFLRRFVQLYPPRNHSGRQKERLTGDVVNLPASFIRNIGGFERPALTFRQLDVLYQRLRLPRVERSEKANKRDLLFLVWAAKAYEKDVKPRLPDVLLNAKPYVERYQRPRSRS